jgi:hypothetical protein
VLRYFESDEPSAKSKGAIVLGAVRARRRRRRPRALPLRAASRATSK